MPKFLQAEIFLILGLGQVGVQVHAVLTGEDGRLAHQFGGNAEGEQGASTICTIEPGLGLW